MVIYIKLDKFGKTWQKHAYLGYFWFNLANFSKFGF